MPKSRPPYPPEFRERIIELVRKGRTPESSLAEQFEPSAQTIRNWLAQADRDAGQAGHPSHRHAVPPTGGLPQRVLRVAAAACLRARGPTSR